MKLRQPGLFQAIVLADCFVVSLVSLSKDFSPGKHHARSREMKRKINWKNLTEKYHLKDIAWALQQKKGKKTKKLQHKFRAQVSR